MLKKRIVSGILLGSAVPLLGFFLPSVCIWIVLVAVSTIAMFEFYRMVNMAGVPAFRMVGAGVGGLIITVTFFSLGPEVERVNVAYHWESMILFVATAAILIRQFPQKHNKKPLSTVAGTLLGILYIPFLLNFATKLLLEWDSTQLLKPVSVTGVLLVFYMVTVVKASDIGAFFVGKFLGRHKLFPRLSPKKTWEGLFGGLFLGVAGSLIYWKIVDGNFGVVTMTLKDVLFLGVFLSLVGMVGDLAESLIKRAANVKDSGDSIGGFGGLLDVLDSLLFAAPAFYFYLRFFAE